MGAAGDEGHVFARRRQLRAHVGAHAAAADDHDTYRMSPSASDLALCCPTAEVATMSGNHASAVEADASFSEVPGARSD